MNNVYTVEEINKMVRNTLLLEPKFRRITVEGEILNLNNRFGRNSVFFSIKDEKSSLPCIILPGNKQNINLNLLENGSKLQLTGTIQVYVPYGRYNLSVTDIKLCGQGDLFIAFEELKCKLEKAGYFDETHKKTIPVFPEKIAIITSKDGDALKDIISTVRKKNTFVDILVFPTKVQGVGAAKNISKMINYANTFSDIDLIIVGRGGGSPEDLWAFNEEVTARSIFKSDIPVISAVGHENDYMLSDMVADLRCKTPLEAGDKSVPDISAILTDLRLMIESMESQLSSCIAGLEKDSENKNPRKNGRILLERIQNSLTQSEKDCEKIRMLCHHKIERENDYVNNLLNNLKLHEIITERQHETELIKSRLDGKNPIDIMQKGFVALTDRNGKMISSAKYLSAGDKVKMKMSDGIAEAKIENVIQNS